VLVAVIGVVRIRVFFVFFLIRNLQIFDGDGYACKCIGHRYIDNLYVAEQVIDVRVSGGTCGKSVLYQLESYRSACLRVCNEVFGGQPA